jgi:hypothetical protein
MSAFESTAWSVNRPNDRDDVRRLLSTCIPPRLKLNSRPRLTASPTSTRDWSRSEKWSVHCSFVFSLTCFFRPAIRKFMAARLAQIDGLIRKQGLGPGHHRGYARIQPDAFPRLVRTFSESALKQSAGEQHF